MNPAVIVPVFGFADDVYRAQAYVVVRRHLLALGWSLVPVMGATPAQARNAGVARTDADVFVFNDADTLVPLEQIRCAASLASDSAGLVFAFSEYRRLGADANVVGIEEALAVAPEAMFLDPPSHGCVAVSRACFEQVGGYDERLEVFEDCALTARCAALWPLRRVAGPAVHLWHERVGEPGEAAYEARYGESRAVWEAEYPWPVEAG